MTKKYMDRGHLLNILLALTKRECEGARLLGFLENQQTAVLEYEHKAYYLWDNGGEMGLDEINVDLPCFIPMSNFGQKLNSLTVAYRINKILHTKDIDYDFAYSNEESAEFLKTLGRKEEMYEHTLGGDDEDEEM
ncbi:MAG: hypothetical protein Q4F84_08970 [Fibrobacter sp.]|nr:hypothetical protein [Fibrobacter sp.]